MISNKKNLPPYVYFIYFPYVIFIKKCIINKFLLIMLDNADNSNYNKEKLTIYCI